MAGSSECVKCTRHVSIYYINTSTGLCRDCEDGKTFQLKPDPRFDTPKKRINHGNRK